MLATIVSILLMQLQPATPARSGIEGIVTHAITGEPLTQTQITLIRTDRADSTTTHPSSSFTDGNGKFRLVDLAPGTYRLFAARNGFTPWEYGQRSNGGRGNGPHDCGWPDSE